MNITNSFRLYFIDAIRAWAILMMLQGHFVDSLLDPLYRDDTNSIYTTWKFFRGITAPAFFTVSGFIFMFLLLKEAKPEIVNPRIKKGIKRGLMLIGIGYLLRTNIFGLLNGEIYPSFYLIDVLHCIGLSIILLIGMYSYSIHRKSYVLPLLLAASGILIFLFEPVYKTWNFSFLPDFLANYFTKVNGSVFTIFPWFGYTAFGAFMAVLFNKYKNIPHLYFKAIAIILTSGIVFTFLSSGVFFYLYRITQLRLFLDILNNNHLFIRLGNVLIVFALFMMLERWLTSKLIMRIGSSTLYVYVIHFIILYGSFTGLGLYKYFHHSLSPFITVSGALLFLIGVTYLSLLYEKNKPFIAKTRTRGLFYMQNILLASYHETSMMARKAKMLIYKRFGYLKN
ncbi:heparan-alpha-glucosaminide N-acetyltransferase domain-containing protein [Leptobacterium sp. I13]|uniref:heparan-alpha-glucosaminide N-acetyltransferase domain-containing protein n=1 Tax=Leptobacterium meishanense TaxID=3128904 RepID=UPI0030EF8FE8